MNPKSNAPKIIVRPGRVMKCGEHLLARVKVAGKWHDVARLAPAKADNPEAGTFVGQYLVVPRKGGEGQRNDLVKESIQSYLIEKAEPAPWAYLCYHTTTTANFYAGESGGVYWELIQATPRLSLGQPHMLPDPHFGTDEEMLAWCERKKIEPIKDAQGNWDWMLTWVNHEARLRETDGSGGPVKR